jgi:uncharacterized surface protein with fasciclin (FAS1) repeats
MIHRRMLGALVLGATAVFAACDSDDPIDAEVGTIVEVAAEAGQFNTLIAAATAAGLDDELSDAGAELTVFAPTDAAFDALPAGTVEALLADPDALAEILLYHVVGGEQDAGEVLAQSFIPTLNGQAIVVGEAGGQPTASGAVIISTNIEASNGIIHVIDAVMLPETRNIVEIASQDGFNTLAAAVVAAGLAETLADADAEFTVFAPTDAAFAALGGTLDALLADPAALADILLYHVVEGRVFSDAVVSASSVQTVEGTDAPISVNGGTVTIDGATVVVTDVQATNGVIHVIDAVITP